MKYFPVFLDLDNQLVVLVGGADGLTPKLANLLKTDARLMVFVKNSNDYLEKLAANNQIELNTGLPSKDTLASARLVYLDGSQVDIHRRLRSQCQSLNVPVNTVDDAGASDFISAAIIDRDPVVVAVSSSGAAPILVRRIKAQIESLLATETGVVARLANKLRPKAKTALDKTTRIAFWHRFFDGLAASRLRRLGFEGCGIRFEFRGFGIELCLSCSRFLFLGGQFSTYGTDVLAVSEEPLEERDDPMNRVFPKVRQPLHALDV